MSARVRLLAQGAAGVARKRRLSGLRLPVAEQAMQLQGVRVAGRLVGVEQRAAVAIGGVRQRAVDEEGAEEGDRAGLHLQRDEAALVELSRVHLERTEAVDRALRMLADGVAGGR